MYMSPGKLILFRCCNIFLCRIAFFSRLLKKILLSMFISKDSKKRYVASSKYFDFRELL